MPAPRFLRTLVLMLHLSLRADAPRTGGVAVTAIGSMVGQPVRTIGLKLMTDGIVGGNLSTIVSGVALICGLQAMGRMMMWTSFNLRMRLRENTQVFLDSYLMDLTAGIAGIEHHERPEYLDHIEVIRAERWAIANPLNPMSWTLASIVQVASAFALLASVDPRLILLPIAGIPAVIATVHAQRVAARLRDEQAQDNRRLRHLQDLTTNPATAKEIRVYELIATVMQRRQSIFGELERTRLRQELRTTGFLVGAWLLFAMCYVAALALTLILARNQQISPGSVVLVLGIGSLLIGNLLELAYNLAWLMRTERAVAKLAWLVDFADQQHAQSRTLAPVGVPRDLRNGIEFRDVAFAYPGTDRPIITHVNLLLPAGKTIAIVGANGAGKQRW